MKKHFLLILSLFSSLVLHGAGAAKPKVVTTTTMITDLVTAVGGDRIDVRGLMGPGVDPHLYKAASDDITQLRQAKLIIYNGLLLEGKMEELFNKMSKSKKVVAITSVLPKEKLLKPEEFEGHHDPHVWFDVELWTQCVAPVVRALSELDPAGKDFYAKRGATVTSNYLALHEWTKKKIAELPAEKRILVTSHDAYNYFGRAYEFQVVGLQGISTVTDANLAAVAKLVDFVKAKKVRAIFVESSVPPNTIQRVRQDAGVKIGGELFSDAMGTPGQMENGYDLGTYEGMVKHNVTTIVDALKQ